MMPSMSNRKEFYEHGLTIRSFNKDETFSHFFNTLTDIYTGKVKEGFSLAQSPKFAGAKNIEPDVINYDPVFVDILTKNNIIPLLKDLTGRDLMLGKVKVRVNYPGAKGYTGWHRDTVIYPKIRKGSIPPILNLNYYPCFNNKPEPALLIWPKSHRRQWDSFWIDKAQVTFTKPETVFETNNDQFIIFDTGHLHDVSPTKYQNGGLRVIYSFCEEFQLGDKSLR